MFLVNKSLSKSKIISKKFFYTLVVLSLMACESTGGDICGMYIC